jgi:hypothetical protein
VTRSVDNPYEITVRVRTITQLFNSLAPSPFRERDLDPHADEFVTAWVRELPRGAPFIIVVELPIEEAKKPEANRIGEAFANYFHHCAETTERDLRELFRVGWRSLLIGLVVLLVCLLGSPGSRDKNQKYDGCESLGGKPDHRRLGG